MSVLLAWDIDGTLLRSGGAGRAALDRAFNKCFQVGGVFNEVDFRGRTDPGLIAEAFELAGRPYSPQDAELLRRTYVVFLEEELERKSDRMQVCPGVEQALAETAKLGHNALLTGNWQEGAVRKLQAAGLGDFFSWGAFGDDGPDRDALVPVLRERAVQLGLSFDRVVVIGDTPADVNCARAGQADVVAVQTGWCTHDDLLRAEPDLIVNDLASGLVPLLQFLKA